MNAVTVGHGPMGYGFRVFRLKAEGRWLHRQIETALVTTVFERIAGQAVLSDYLGRIISSLAELAQGRGDTMPVDLAADGDAFEDVLGTYGTRARQEIDEPL
jgi:hypothetical protein